MSKIIAALENLGKDIIDFQPKGFVFGEELIKTGKRKIKKCLLTSRVTRTVIAKAAQEQVNLIISIIPPKLTQGYEQKINNEELDLLKLLIENKIGIFSIGEKWLSLEEGGIDYLLELCDFQYYQPFDVGYLNQKGKKKHLTGRIGERKKKLTLQELIDLIYHLSEENFKFLGYSEHPIQKLAVFANIPDSNAIHELRSLKKFDALLIGDLAYDGLLALQLAKLPAILLEKRTIENIALGQLRRKIMEEVTIDLPEIITCKQEQIGTVFTG